MTNNEIKMACNVVTSTTETIDVATAKRYLLMNTYNRKPNANTVKDYAEEMCNGNWCCNGETIVFSDNGVLLDGQQRLMAVVKCGVSIASVVVVGVDMEAFDSMNQGRKRSNGAVLEISGTKKHATLVASTVRAVFIYKEHGSMRVSTGGSFSPRKMKVAMTGMKNIESQVEYASTFKRPLFTPTVVASLFHIFSEVNAKDAKTFMDAILNGTHGGDMELLKLRNHFLDMKMRGVTLNRKRELVCGIMIKGWNAWRTGSVMEDFEYNKGEQFPKAR